MRLLVKGQRQNATPWCMQKSERYLEDLVNEREKEIKTTGG
jgi:hypothetical protein